MIEDLFSSVYIEPIEETITPNGTHFTMEIHADTEEEARRGAEIYGAMTNSDLSDFRGPISPERRSFGFDSTRWGGCNWEPEGPKKNWAPINPQNLN